MSFTQQLQRHSRHHGGRSSHGTHVTATTASNGTTNGGGGGGAKYGNKKHSNLLPNVQEYQSNIGELVDVRGFSEEGLLIDKNSLKIAVNEADLFDLGCMSPLYASPPHSPSSDVSSPGQHGEEPQGGGGGGEGNAKGTSITDNHFTRDTHMRIILGGGKAENGGAQS